MFSGFYLVCFLSEKKQKKMSSRTPALIILVYFIAVPALILSILSIFYPNYDSQLNAIRTTTTELEGNITHLQMENTLLQNQVVELMMSSANETIIQEGRFVWAMGGTRDRYPGDVCNDLVVTGFAINTAGTGYRVGDLVFVTNIDTPSTIQFYDNPVLKITAVGGSGEVVSFDVLTPGCLAANPMTNNSISTMTIVGSGLTVKRYAGPYPPIDPNTYYVFQTPQANLVAPLQYANYSLRQVTIESVAYTVLYIYPPEFPIIPESSGASNALDMILYEFDPLIPALQALGSYYYVFPLTQKNYNAISLVDDTNCLATSVDCWLDTYGGSSRDSPTAFALVNTRDGFDDQIANHYIQFHFTSTGYTHDYVANNAVLTLNYPFMLVLPSL